MTLAILLTSCREGSAPNAPDSKRFPESVLNNGLTEAEFVFFYNDGIIIEGACDAPVGYVELPKGISDEIDNVGGRGFVFSEVTVKRLYFCSRSLLGDLGFSQFGEIDDLKIEVAFPIVFGGRPPDFSQFGEMIPLGENKIFFLKNSDVLMRYIVAASTNTEESDRIVNMTKSRLENELMWYRFQKNLWSE